MAPRPTRNSGGLGNIEALANPAPAASRAQSGSSPNSTVEQMQQLQAQARLVDNSAAGAGADVVEDDLVEANEQEVVAPEDNRAPVADEVGIQDDLQRNVIEYAPRRIPDYANLDLEEDVRQFFKSCDPDALAHKKRVEDGLRGALQDPFEEPQQGPFPKHREPEQHKATKTYASKGKARRRSSDSDSELSEEVR
ncbi:unnamed protein product [Tilletia controversa]|nr:unnamed protein product [Tilletia controversa]